MNSTMKQVITWVLLIVAAVFLWLLVVRQSGAPKEETISLTEFMSKAEASSILEATIKGSEVTGKYRDRTDKVFRTTIPTNYPDVYKLLREKGVNVTVVDLQAGIWLAVVVNVLPFLLIIGFWVFMMRQMQAGGNKAMSFGKSRARLLTMQQKKITFKDVAGVDEAKEELQEIIEFLREAQKFQKLGGRIPKGVLLVGPPGTGKTLLARAVAGEANVPFFSISGSDFVEMFVGVGASRVRDLFEQGKKNAPCIIFIDEIDAVGRHRGAGLGGGHDEREQTLNQLLVEMDGFDTRQAVVVIAATNRPDGLDIALLRPGRFDRRVTVDRPDWNGRLAILKIHAKGVPMGPDVDFVAIARATVGMVGADLANLVNEAALLAARRNMDYVNQHCFDDALDKILLGAERPLVLRDEDLNVTAYHEGGHALAGLLTEFSDPVTKVTIVPHGQALGVTMSTPLDDRYNYSKDYLLSQIVFALGGRAAEQVAIGHITTGAENDLQRVTAIARQMVTRWGMSERVGTISFSERSSPFAMGGETGAPSDYSETMAEIIDEEVESIVNASYARALELMTTHRLTLDRIAQELRKHETIDARKLQDILRETGATPARHDNAAMPGAALQEFSLPEMEEPPLSIDNGYQAG